MNHTYFRIALALSSLLIPALTAPLQAQDNTFTNAIDTDITNGSNWSEGTPVFGTTISSGRWNINGTTDYDQGDTTVDNGRSLVISNGDSSSGSLTISGGTLTLGGSSQALIAAPSPSGQGNGSLILDGGNFTTPGELSVLSRGNAASTGTLTINNGSTFTADITSFGILSFTTGVGTINVNSGGVLQSRVIFNRRNGTNNVLNLDGGTLRANDNDDDEDWIRDTAGGITFNVLAGGGTLDSDGHLNQHIQNVINGTASGDLTVTGGGSIIFENDNTYDGDTTIDAGTTLILGNGGTTGTLGSGSLIITDGTSTLGFGHSDDLVQSTSLVTAEIATGLATGNLEQRGPGTLTLDVANTFAGTTEVTGGTLEVAHTDALQNSSAISASDGGTLLIDGGLDLTKNVSISDAGVGGSRGALRGGADTLGNTVSGNVTITANNSRIGTEDGGNLSVTGDISDGGNGHNVILRPGDNGTLTVSGSNSWGGDTNFFGNTGSLILGSTDTLPTGSKLGAGTGTIDLNGNDQTVAGITPNGTPGTLTNNGATDSTLTIDNTVDYTFNGIFEDGTTNVLSLVKSGTATQTLTGTSTYTGGTTVSAGCLILGQATAIPASGSGTTVAADAGLGFNSAGLTDGEIATIVSNVSWDATSDLVFTVNAPNTELVTADLSSFSGDTIVLKGDGTLDLSGATLPGGVTLETPDGGIIETGGVAEITVNSVAISSGSVSGKKVTIDFTAGGNVDAYASDTLQSGSWSLVASGISSSPADVEDNVAAPARFYVLVPEGDGDPYP